MITVDPNKKVVRETKAPYEYEENGELKTAEIRVLYHSASTKDLKAYHTEVQAKIKAAKEKEEVALFWHTDKLFRRLHSLPDLVDQNEKPFEITLDFLDSLDPKNVKAIVNAIEEDENPKSENTEAG